MKDLRLANSHSVRQEGNDSFQGRRHQYAKLRNVLLSIEVGREAILAAVPVHD